MYHSVGEELESLPSTTPSWEIRPAGEVVREMMDEARRIIVERLSPMADEGQ